MQYVYDISGLIHAGYWGSNKSVNDEIKEYLSFPVGGIRYALERIFGDIMSEPKGTAICICVFDSPTKKKEDYESYKANRKFNPNIWIQSEFLYDLLPKLGVGVLRAGGMEADDLIINYVRQNYDKMFEPNFTVVTDDADIYCVVRDRCIITGASSHGKRVIPTNFEGVVSRNCLVSYNTMTPYLLLCGKPSNNLKPVESGNLWYRAYLEWLNSCPSIAPYKGTYKEVFVSFLSRVKELISSGGGPSFMKMSTLIDILKRVLVCFPKECTSRLCPVVASEITSDASEILSILCLPNICKYLNIPYDKYALTRSSGYADKWASIYMTSSVDTDITADATFLFSDYTSGEEDYGGF